MEGTATISRKHFREPCRSHERRFNHHRTHLFAESLELWSGSHPDRYRHSQLRRNRNRHGDLQSLGTVLGTATLSGNVAKLPSAVWLSEPTTSPPLMGGTRTISPAPPPPYHSGQQGVTATTVVSSLNPSTHGTLSPLPPLCIRIGPTPTGTSPSRMVPRLWERRRQWLGECHVQHQCAGRRHSLDHCRLRWKRRGRDKHVNDPLSEVD